MKNEKITKEKNMIKANIDNNVLEVQYAQDKYISYARATGRVARVLDEVVPDVTLRHNSLMPVSEDFFEKLYTPVPIQ